MVVHVGHEQHGQRAFFLRRQRFAPRCRPLRGDDAVERAVRIALARLVIEREDDLAFHVSGVVVVRKRRRADAESDECDLSRHAAAGAEPGRIEFLACVEPPA